VTQHAAGSPAVIVVSDVSAAAAEPLVRAVLGRFSGAKVGARRVLNAGTPDAVRRVMEEARSSGSVVVHAMASEELRQKVSREGERVQVITVDLIDPIVRGLARQRRLIRDVAAASPLQDSADETRRRVEAIAYAIRHDDGRDPFGFIRADVVLAGVSRTSKTPLSLYLAWKGWRVANVPVILNLPLPGPLMKIDQGRLVGLVVSPERLVELRRARLRHPEAPLDAAYANRDHVRIELSYSRALFRKAGWPVIDMTTQSIEEAAEEVLDLVRPFEADRSGVPTRARRRRRASPRDGTAVRTSRVRQRQRRDASRGVPD
jgi:regulator of PEP synthase PpsR (kinase-PPPase family)